jgi:subtilase family serine protease
MKAVSRLDAGTRMDLAIALPLRNQKGLTELLRELYDPRSPMFHHYLTPEQFAAQFGPSQADYDAVAKYAGAHGLAVTYRHPNRLLLDVAGRAGDVEKALHVTMRVYRHPTEGRLFYAPDREPSLDLQTPVAHVSGLDNYAPPQPRVLERPATARGTRAVAGNAGTGPNGEYMGKDFRAAYAPGVTLTGSGQAVGLLQFDGYSSSDITYYETAAGLPTVTCTNVLLDHSNGRVQSSNGQTEVSLDIEMTMSMAPGIAKIIVYEAPPTGNYWHDLLNRMATDNLAKQLSCSWYIPGGTEDTVADGIFQEMAAQGQTFFSASGDSDAFTGLIPFPGDTPYITEVGGTTLTENGNGGSYNSETVWNWGNGSGSGGGISTQYGIPSWQQGISMTASKGSTTMRNVPDVAMTADNVYVRAGGADHDVGGTSCAAPLWAGFMALVNQEAALNGRGPVGFLNPAVYGIGTGAKYGTAFHDITNGNNTSTNSPNNFYAVSGYDLCTGWGTPTGSVLINALALGAEGLQLSASPFVTGGPAGGPFNPGSYSYSFVDSGTNALTWTASATQAWLSLSATSGTLAVGGTATVVATINANANGLGNGVYTDTITFTDTGTGFVETEPVTLTVSAPPSITSGLTATATNGVGFNYQIVASNSPTGYGASGLPGGLSVNGATGLISGNTTATGTYNVGLSAANASGTGTATLTLTVLPAAPVITSALTATTTVGMGFDYQITASNGAVSYSASGLPAGLSVDPTAGLISGTATAIGSSNVTIAATNAGGTGSATLALTVNPQAPVITSGLTATGTNGGGFSYQITATNNPGSYSASGLPAGLGINSTSGIISGTATVTGTFNATINATNAGGTGSATLVITMLPPAPVITSALSAAAVYGQGFSYQITASVPATFAASGLPAGLSVDPNSGIISGTTTATGVNDVIISAINSSGTGSATLVLTVSPPGPVITSATTAIGIVGLSFNYQITASNSPTSYGANGLPGGLSVNTSSGVIHGTPSTTGTSYASIIATNGSGRGSATLMIVVKPPGPVITSSTTAFATEGQAFSYQITATNNPTSYAASGLPAGLSIDTVGGVISGTIPVTGTTSINISAVNQTSVGTAVLTVVTRTPYASWKSGVFAAADLSSASISGDTATPAGDGIPNLMKYALNLNPYADGVGGLPVAGIMTTGSGNYLALTYTQVLAATDISYIVEVSGDLQTWNSGSGYTLTPVVTPNGDGVTETVVVPAAGPLTSGTQCQFMRLRVTLP